MNRQAMFLMKIATGCNGSLCSNSEAGAVKTIPVAIGQFGMELRIIEINIIGGDI